MNEQDKAMMDKLIQDKGKRYRVVIDNDSVWVEDKENNDEPIHDFSKYGYELVEESFKYLGMDAELC
jgi:hypothetical protein